MPPVSSPGALLSVQSPYLRGGSYGTAVTLRLQATCQWPEMPFQILSKDIGFRTFRPCRVSRRVSRSVVLDP